MGRVIHWVYCKKSKFDHTNKWYIGKSESILENVMHKSLWDFEIQTDHLIPARRLDLVFIYKKKITCHLKDFAVPLDLRVKKKTKRLTISWTLPVN